MDFKNLLSIIDHNIHTTNNIVSNNHYIFLYLMIFYFAYDLYNVKYFEITM